MQDLEFWKKVLDNKICPVCGYHDPTWEENPEADHKFMDEPLYWEDGENVYASRSCDICPCCLTEFGVSEYEESSYEPKNGTLEEYVKSWAALRLQWIDKGCPWEMGDLEPPPKNWDPAEQLKRVGFDLKKYLDEKGKSA
jgi:hypothetical protein